MAVEIKEAAIRADKLAARLFRQAGYIALVGWEQASSAGGHEGWFSSVQAATIRKQGWIEWFLSAGAEKRSIFAELEQVNWGKGGFRLKIFGRDRLEQMKQIAEEIQRQVGCKVEIVVAGEGPLYREVFPSSY